ncbi:restriction endonuclease subunit S [Cellvibrio sp. NN19]|uniref:restriction endonuclease subunit S n=1 Tax=Cellvibrio chitinivorans TaxID=3102792 RepID=UPI002B411385|nr:restriction endonuclease subunit S [Cellvibrio sp. NN19]
MSAQQIITQHLDIWTAAHKTRSGVGRGSSNKLDLYGIKKLRELILELAVRGKLVPQDANDEPASELLKRIAHDIAESEKSGTIKKDVPVSINSDDEPFDLPAGWEMVSFGNICTIERGGSPRPIQDFLTNAPDGINWIKIGDSDIGGKYITSTAEKIRKEGLVKTRMVYPGDFLLTNSMSFGRPYITQIEGCIHDGWLRISPPKELDKNFLYYLLSSPFIFRSFKKAAAGAVVLNLNADKVRVVELLLPPLAEQHRIVAKVDELMAFCDQLEQTQSDNIAAHAQLVEALLATLTNSSDHTELQNNWQRIATHFDTLFTTEHSIDQLKQTILQLAVMGKLFPQNPTDEPASELLKKIAAEKNRLEIEERLRTTAEECIDESEHYIQLPHGWEFARLGNLAKFIDYRGKTPTKVESGIPLITAKNVRFGYIDRDPAEYITESDYEVWMTRGYPRLNDILFTTEAPLGNVALVDIEDKFALAQRVICFQLHEPDLARFIRIAIMSAQFQNQLIENATGMTATGVKASKLKEIPIVIPPLEEQHRIVAKVDELMALCETLKINLQNAQTTQLALADALVEQAI